METDQPCRAWPNTAAPLFAMLKTQSATFGEILAWQDKEYTTLATGFGWTAAEHLEHLAMATRSGLFLLEQIFAEPTANHAAQPNQYFALLLKLGHFPRGKTESPDFARPRGLPVKKVRANIKRMIAQTSGLGEHVAMMDACSGRSEHPALGFLTASQWLQFFVIHQNHHLEILAEIQTALRKM